MKKPVAGKSHIRKNITINLDFCECGRIKRQGTHRGPMCQKKLDVERQQAAAFVVALLAGKGEGA